MIRKSVRAALVILLLMTSFVFERVQAMTCADFFRKPTALKAVLPSRALAAPSDEIRAREYVEIQDRFSQVPEKILIGKRFIQSHHYLNDERGDFVSVVFYLKGDPLAMSTQAALAAPSFVTSRLPVIATNAAATASPIALRPHEVEAVLRKYIIEVISTRAQPLDQRTVNELVVRMKSDSASIEAARQHSQTVMRSDDQPGDSGMAIFANHGANRYLRFTPRDSSVEVQARILDLHRTEFPYGFYMLVEWLLPSSDGQVRRVALVSEAELATARILSADERREVAQAFNDSLSPNEVEARKLAKILKLHTFGFTSFDRVPSEERRNGTDPLSQMSILSHLAMRAWIVDRFGSIDDLMTPEERNEPAANVLDVMARLNPLYVLKRFAPRGDDFRYGFVITEDGRLKITPHGSKETNLKRQMLRLAAGRRIFVAGTFEVDTSGELKIVLESTYYQDHADSWGSGSAFRTQTNGDLDPFLAAVFRVQMRRAVASISGRRVDSYYEADPQDIYHGWSGERTKHGNSRFGGFESEEAASFVRETMTPASPKPSTVEIKWDNGQPLAHPLAYEAWLEATGRSTKITHLEWVRADWRHYVLKSNKEQSFAEIRTSYKKLMSRFHSDKHPEFAEKRVASIVAEAFQETEKLMNESQP